MPANVTYPGVYIDELPSAVRTITGVPTSVAAFVGTAPRGASLFAPYLAEVTEIREVLGQSS